jgi:hypothetical protein
MNAPTVQLEQMILRARSGCQVGTPAARAGHAGAALRRHSHLLEPRRAAAQGVPGARESESDFGDLISESDFGYLISESSTRKAFRVDRICRRPSTAWR